MIENNVNTWAETIASLPDNQFSSIMRLYLGEIKTPYNKQRLTSQLAVFIRQNENAKSIITLLDSFDIKVLTAISLISNPTQEKISDFFKNSFSIAQIYSEIINLKERLLIYTVKESEFSPEILFINPLLNDELSSYLDINLLFPKEEITLFSTDDVFTISPNFLAAFISYIKIHKLSCKNDGGLKKNDITRLEQLFPGRIECIQYLLTALINLSILIDDTKSLKIDNSKLDNFAELSFANQCAFLCAASVSRFSREGLAKEAQLLLDCINSIPQTGYTTQTLLWLAFLAGSYTPQGNATVKTGRFSQLLQQARPNNNTNANADLLSRMIDSAIALGLLQKLGTNAQNQSVYIKSNFEQQEQILSPGQDLPKVLNIDSTFTVTLMPGLSLKSLLPFTSFTNITKCGIVTEFEISKQSVSMGFDTDYTPEKIFQIMEQYTYYELPKNLKINIQEWYNSYSSAIIYQGYILKVAQNNIAIAENSPKIKKYLKEKLADGIYLLNIPLDSNIDFFRNESGLEFLGNIKAYSYSENSTAFPSLRKSGQLPILEQTIGKTYNSISIKETEELIKELRNALSTMEMDQHKKECLEHRINNRMILTTKQLEIASIRTELLEAEGMDYSGKIHLIETSIKENDMLELQLPDAAGNFVTLIGKPLSLTKQQADALMRFQLIPEDDIDNILVSRITHIKRLRY